MNNIPENEFNKWLSEFSDLADNINRTILSSNNISMMSIYYFIKDCERAGWNRENYGNVEYWLTHKMGELIEKFEKKK